MPINYTNGKMSKTVPYLIAVSELAKYRITTKEIYIFNVL
jgi:hypothetical protein